ncbi:MAG: hypothetical protein F8N37_23895 [Telmatospirillum sp.]|nr:hypothetical protein [Telmatospirillum sp.]
MDDEQDVKHTITNKKLRRPTAWNDIGAFLFAPTAQGKTPLQGSRILLGKTATISGRHRSGTPWTI